MKKSLILLLQILPLFILAQSPPPSSTFQAIPRYRMFDHISDRFGNEYILSTIALNAARPLTNSNYSVSSIPTNSCSAGYFNLYFAPGSLFDQNSSAAGVLCEVFRNVSGFLNSPLSATSNTVKINIYCDNLSGGSLATASPFYVCPYNPLNPNAGIIDNQIQKAIITGLDPFANLPITLFPGTTNFYSGYININPSIAWNFNLATVVLTAGFNDAYSVLLHEVCHALGFASLISSNGVSMFGAANNYFARYDQFLKNASGVSLLSASLAACPTSSISFQGSPTSINPGSCTGSGIDATTCSVAVQYSSTLVNAKVYTPFCWESGSSLSHFEDMCTIPPSFTTSCVPNPTAPGYNNLYYVMSNVQNTGSCYVKRYLKPEERYVLCDLGYSVKTTYTSNAIGANFTYSGSTCPGTNIWGVHDGFVNNAFTYTTNGSVFDIPISTILSNDATSATQLSCLEVIYNTATVSIVGSSLSVASSSGAGLVVIKYLPTNSSGQLGNATYVYVYFLPGNCGGGTCNMVQNGDLEAYAIGSNQPCGAITNNNSIYSPLLSCWIAETTSSPDLFVRNCNLINPPGYNLGLSTFSASPPFDSHNGSPNNKVIGLAGSGNGSELFKNSLSVPLIPGQSYQLSIWLLNTAQTPYGASQTSPIVVDVVGDVSIANVIDNINYVNQQPIIAEFTVTPNVWTQFTNTFVFSPTLSVSHNVIAVGLNPFKTNLLNGGGVSYLLIDDVSLIPITSPNPAFNIPNASNCGNTSFTNLAQYSNFVGTFSGTGVTFNSGFNQYNFNSPPTLPSGIYPVAFTYTNNGCVNTISQNISLGTPNFSVSTAASGSPVYCTNLTPPSPACTLIATSNPSAGVSYVWQPGNIMGATVTAVPLASGVYTVYAMGNCQLTSTLAVSVSNSCCSTATVPALSQTALASGIVVGPATVNGTIYINPSQNVTFATGEFLMAPNNRIVVNPGAMLTIKDSHLRSCGNTMWQGIVVRDGGRLVLTRENYSNLIEDAITAVDISNHTTSTLTNILTANNTTFNKNFVDINVSNYLRSSTSFNNAFSIHSCVFSSRNYTFTSTQWPEASSTPVIAANGLRTVSNSTTGLAAPYLLQSTSIALLKNPYSTQTSSIAIKMTDVGTTVGSTFYGANIGSPNNIGQFNLFDTHHTFMYLINSNVKTTNNVFQNTQFTTSSAALGNSKAIYSGDFTGNNFSLDLRGNNKDVGNRFWNCHTGIEVARIFDFSVENATFRSAQSTTTLTSTALRSGMYLNTNKFNYLIRYNEFTNLYSGINVAMISGQFTATPPPSCSNCLSPALINATKLAIVQNTFAPQTATSTPIGTNFLNQAVQITVASPYFWVVSAPTSTPSNIGLVIERNTVNRAFRGIYLNDISGLFPNSIINNTVSLQTDATYSVQQQGIAVLGTTGKNIVAGNYLSGEGVSAPTNTLATLVYCSINTGINSPSVTCNTLSNSNKGFEFNSTNSLSIWAGNIMQPLKSGLVLSGNGEIGQQGTNATAISNQWTGSWTGVNGTFVDGSSFAIQSPLWVNPTALPPSNSGFSTTPIQWYGGVPGTLLTTVSGGYNCVGIPNNKVHQPPVRSKYYSNETFYIARTALYRLLYETPSLRTGNSVLNNFYNSLSGSNIQKFMQVEQRLNNVDFAGARTINTAITTTNTVEANYKNYYNLYLTFGEAGFRPTTALNQEALLNLASLCPASNGACIYQARALYNAVFKEVVNYVNNCNKNTGARMADDLQDEPTLLQTWELNIFPNPATNQITLVSNTENEMLNVNITDISGRTVLTQDVKLNGFMVNLDLSLLNGAYVVTIKNSNNETITKKLLIAK